MRRTTRFILSCLLLMGAGTALVPGTAATAAAPALGSTYLPMPAHRLGTAIVFPHDTATVDDVDAPGTLDQDTVRAVVVAITVYAPVRAGVLDVYAEDRSRTGGGVVRYVAGVTSTHLVLVPTTWRLGLYNPTVSRVNVAVDLQGYVRRSTTTTAGGIGPTGRTTVADSRTGTGTARSPLAASSTRSVSVRAAAPGATAVLLELTAIHPSATGSFVTYASGSARPGIPVGTFSRGQDETALALVPIGADGRVVVANASSGSVGLQAVVIAGVGAGAPTDPGTVVATPTRTLLSTGVGLGAPRRPVTAGHYLDVHVAGHAGVPAAGAGAVAVQLVAWHPSRAGAVVAYAADAARPGVRSVSFTSGHTQSDLAIVPLSAAGTIRLWVTGFGTVDLSAYVEGWVRSPTVVTGRVVDPAGHPVRDAVVIVHDDLSDDAILHTGTDGRYTYAAAVAGAHSVCVQGGEGPALGYAPQCVGTSDPGDHSSHVTLVAGHTTTENLTLSLGGAVSGLITSVDGTKLFDVQVGLTSGGYSLNSGSDIPGSYQVTGLPAGTYSVCFFPSRGSDSTSSGYARACYGGPAGDTTARVVVTAGHETRNVNAVLAKGATITGHLTHQDPTLSISHDEVQVSQGGRLVGRNYPDDAGNYTVDALPAGPATVCVDPGITFDVPQCTDVSLISGQVARGLDFDLVSGDEVYGEVDAPSGAAVSGATVTATAADGTTTAADTNSAGLYRLPNIMAGPYTFCARADGHAQGCFGPAQGPATSVTLPPHIGVRVAITLGS